MFKSSEYTFKAYKRTFKTFERRFSFMIKTSILSKKYSSAPGRGIVDNITFSK